MSLRSCQNIGCRTSTIMSKGRILHKTNSLFSHETFHNKRMLRTSSSLNNTHVAETSSPSFSTVNPSEIAFFSRLSAQWWDEKGEFSFLHKMNPVRMQFIREKILEVAREERGEEAATEMESRAGLLEGLDVLDVGCGGGLLSESLSRLGARTMGIDASLSNITIASLHASTDPRLSFSGDSPGSLTYQHIPVEDLLTNPRRFDVVCSMEVLEHVDNPAGFLSACAQLLKPGGHLFLSTIARTPLSYLLTIFGAEYVLRKVTRGTHTHAKFINPSELVAFFQKHHGSPSIIPEHDGQSWGEPWITRTYEHDLPARTEAEIRGIIYIPWKGRWVLAPRAASAYPVSTDCNYLFWIRRPQ